MKKSWWIASTAGALVVVAAVVLVVRELSGPTGGTDPDPTPSSSEAAASDRRAVLAVKIDNVAAARPQTGLSAADLVYVEPVEGGLTRLLALYRGRPPAVIGPVRSARATDLSLLAQFGRPALAYSGAAPELLPSLRSASLTSASPAEIPDAYFRDDSRPSPHNLYLRPQQVPDGEVAPEGAFPATGAAPGSGAAAAAVAIRYPAAAFTFTWSADIGRYLIGLDGSPLTSVDEGQAAAATIVEQRVAVRLGERGETGTVPNSPIAQTVGTGKATMWRDGQRFAATWDRTTATAPTQFTATSGQLLPVSDGPLWILLVPA
ncbi:DUF3048 domain-containing protein [Amycolatopsis regifaucium]|uniref:DUF3048 domain-containing protein n=1 Tax=Amycolatopsis regifaucium TaxID=546365 RepID=A0A154MNF7_9PSEU|nr:DUF3048 domain-containing protein [Amycolatopsis regifaucium]KZB85811.1 hypothetical protein AVL48_30680 [Amycolatopsis regifaucium]SFI76723.1 Protein of unknown function [Amycolatopsis regifaucium]